MIAKIVSPCPGIRWSNYLIDVPQEKTFINVCGSTHESIRAFIEKMCDISAFTDSPDETVFCGHWEARLYEEEKT